MPVTISIWTWPNAADRSNNLAIGSWAWQNGAGWANGEIDEMETFTYNLAQSEITRSFNVVKNVDGNLNGIADLLEDAPVPRPFMGVPFPVTGVIEAEQFDMGGPEVGYHANDSANATTNYRVCKLCVTTCSDPMGGGYCVDKLRVGEWMNYSINVRVAQTYAIEPRVAGIGVGGQFSVSFSSPGNSNYTSAAFTVPTTSWTNVLAKNIFLNAGTNIMTVKMVADGTNNGADSGMVATLNYISVYPSWNEGLPTGLTNIWITNSLILNAMDWNSGQSNAMVIQSAIDSLASSGGTVNLPAGTFCLASLFPPNETQPIYCNAAVYATNNVGIRGSNTTLVAHDRCTTLFYAGRAQPTLSAQGKVQAGNSISVTNFTLSDLGLVGSPHWRYTAGSSNQCVFDSGYLTNTFPSGWCSYNGALVAAWGDTTNTWVTNLLVTNCWFTNAPYYGISLPGNVVNFLSRSNGFVYGASSNYGTLVRIGGIPIVGIMVQASGQNFNSVVRECLFNGNIAMTSIGWDTGADGLLYFQQNDGNWFAARNAITNYGLEAIQWNSGPAAAVQNTFCTLVDTPSTCALNNPVEGIDEWPGGVNADDASFCFVGNIVIGGRHGVLSDYNGYQILRDVTSLVVSGNTFNLDGPLTNNPNEYSGFGAATWIFKGDRLDIAGNTLVTGGYGLQVGAGCTNALVLANDFSKAVVGSIDGSGTAGLGLLNAQIARNKLGSGSYCPSNSVSDFHVYAPYANGANYFLLQNSYLDVNSNPINPAFIPANLPVNTQ